METILFQLKNYFDPFIKTRIADWHMLERYLKIEHIKRRTTLKYAGEKEQFLRFILKGGAAIKVKQGIKDICFDLCFENDFLADFRSLNIGHPTNIYIRTFEPLSMVAISREQLFNIYRMSPLGTQLGRILAEQQSLRSQMHFIALLGKSPEERYRILMDNRPQLLLRAPQHYLASYIGVSAESLSRIRKRVGGV